MHHKTRTIRAWLAVALALPALTLACGDGKKGGDSAPSRGPIASIFENEAQKNQIPARYLYAVAFTASGMQPKASTVRYGKEKRARSLSANETLFGLSAGTIGLDNTPETSVFAAQVPAYAAYVRQALDNQQIKLTQQPQTTKDKYDWIANLAKLHYANQDMQTIFINELIDVLNNGRRWQDPESGEILELLKESQAISPADIPSYQRDSLKLHGPEGQIFPSQSLSLDIDNHELNNNNPRRIIVTHCPLSLSACLAMQSKNANTSLANSVALGAHYVISPNNAIDDRPLQIVRHSTAVRLTNTDGVTETIQDALVIMLTGESGHYEEGRRIIANPMWFNKYQLLKLGLVVDRLCRQIVPSNDDEPCTLGNAIEFRQSQGSSYRFGDIPDFTEDIFLGYVKNPNRKPGDASITWADTTKTFAAGREIKFSLNFAQGITNIIVQKAKRCPNGRLIWSPINETPVQQAEKKDFALTILRRGPNGNGQHFFRTLLYDNNNELAAWTQDEILVKNYEQADEMTTDTRSCQNL